jgi:hypothetical protein
MKHIKASIQEMILRIKSESPKFWRRMMRFMIGLGALGTALYVVREQLPQPVAEIAGYLITIGVVGTFLSSLTTTDPILRQEIPSSVKVEEKKQEKIAKKEPLKSK